jgi:AcrR family transcriptional regulator
MDCMSRPQPSDGGLRERKKRKARQTIRQEAFRLFAQQGYRATTVDQIAAAAEVSPATFFRYFGSKDQLILSDEYDAALAEAIAKRPPGEPIMTALRHALTDSLLEVLDQDREELLTRVRLSFGDPDVRAQAMDEQLRNQDEVARVLADHLGRDVDDHEIACAAAAIIAISMTVLRHWVADGGQGDLAALYEQHLQILQTGLPF